jgi:stage IV sporulation protein FA
MEKGKIKKKSMFEIFLNKFLISSLLTIICMIFLRKNVLFYNFFRDNILSVNFNFASVNDLYNKYFGGVLPLKNFFSDSSLVFNEKLSYSGYEGYLDGVSLDVIDDYLVPSLDTGLVVFIGDKEGYGDTVIVQQANGIDVWYSNMSSINVNMYEYVSKGNFIGNCSSKLVLVFKKDGKVLDYNEYI